MMANSRKPNRKEMDEMSTTALVKEYAKYKRNVIKSRLGITDGMADYIIKRIDKVEECHRQGIITTDEAMRIISEV